MTFEAAAKSFMLSRSTIPLQNITGQAKQWANRETVFVEDQTCSINPFHYNLEYPTSSLYPILFYPFGCTYHGIETLSYYIASVGSEIPWTPTLRLKVGTINIVNTESI
ncbi:unnamed protein product [Calicophoron daubneyi]|uniref:Arrestin-like N-terminal domain-containing protein n=1 Tax=Calicophoron daubneyi TaxID=300641 RepID=A0AAV2TEJ5_CALDB